MGDINFKSVNKTILVGKVVGKIESGKTAAGNEFCRFNLETEEYLLVKGESKVFATRHDIFVTNRYAVRPFNQHLREGFYVAVTGKLGVINGKQIVQVTDFGHDATIMYIPPDNQSQAPASRTMGAASASRDQSGDDFLKPEAVTGRKSPNPRTPEGFEDDDIPF